VEVQVQSLVLVLAGGVAVQPWWGAVVHGTLQDAVPILPTNSVPVPVPILILVPMAAGAVGVGVHSHCSCIPPHGMQYSHPTSTLLLHGLMPLWYVLKCPGAMNGGYGSSTPANSLNQAVLVWGAVDTWGDGHCAELM